MATSTQTPIVWTKRATRLADAAGWITVLAFGGLVGYIIWAGVL